MAASADPAILTPAARRIDLQQRAVTAAWRAGGFARDCHASDTRSAVRPEGRILPGAAWSGHGSA